MTRQSLCGWSGGQLLPHAEAFIRELPDLQHSGFGSDSSCGLAYYPDSRTCYFQDARAGAVVIGSLLWKDSKYQQLQKQHDSAYALLCAYREFGARMIEDLGGHFILAIMDDAHKQVVLAIDKLGTHKLYYTYSNDTLSFSNNARQALQLAGQPVAISTQAIYDYLCFHVVPSPNSIYRNLKKLQPGECLVFNNGRVRVFDYWQPRFEHHIYQSQKDAAEELHHLIDRAIARNVSQSQINQTGILLGCDRGSAVVAKRLAQQNDSANDAFSISFDALDKNSFSHARKNLKQLRVHLHEHRITTQDVLAIATQIAMHTDEPLGNSAIISMYYAARLAIQAGKRHVLTGYGARELFGGESSSMQQKARTFYGYVPKWLKTYLLASSSAGARPHSVPRIDKLKFNIENGAVSEAALIPEVIAKIDYAAPYNLMRNTYAKPITSNDFDRFLFLSWKQKLADDRLHQMHTASTLAGIVVDHPLLDEDLLSFSMRLPTAWKLRDMGSNYFFKSALRRFLPAAIFKKTKHGFELPLGAYMRNHAPLRELANESLKSLAKRGYFEKNFIEKMLQFDVGEQPQALEKIVWALITLELWLQTHTV